MRWCVLKRGNKMKISNLRNGMLPPDAERLHKTSGTGSPPTRH